MKELLLKTRLNKCGLETLVEVYVFNGMASVLHNGIETKVISCSSNNERLAIFAKFKAHADLF